MENLVTKVNEVLVQRISDLKEVKRIPVNAQFGLLSSEGWSIHFYGQTTYVVTDGKFYKGLH